MVIDTDSPPSNPSADFEDFFKKFEDVPNEFRYRKKISESYANSNNYITVLFEDILNFNPLLANYLKNSPEEALEEAVEAYKNIVRIDAGGFFASDVEYNVRISTENSSNEVDLRKIRAKHIDKLIYIKGIIIRSSIVHPKIVNATFECPICANITQNLQSTSKLKPPNECANPNCKNKKDFKVLTNESEFINYQYITIQEAPEELDSGDIPQTLPSILVNKLTDTVRPGERVKIMGILKTVPKEDRRGRLSTVFITKLMVNNIEGIKQNDSESNLTQNDIDEINALSREPKIQKKIARSIARTILGHENLKLGAALSLFGGNQKIKKDGSKLRGDIHVLFLGDPGTGKSQILQNVAQIAPRSIYTSGKGASAAGLTAAVIKEKNNGGMQLEAGALVLASGGIACIDEFDKMRRQDRSAIHEALAQQTISIAKAGIVATLQAKTAIIAAANPKEGRWNDYETAAANINLSPPILSRFDLIFIVRDLPDKDQDNRIAEYILKNHMEGYEETYVDDDKAEKSLQDDFIPINLLKKYVKYGRNNCHPKLTKEAAKIIQKFYVKMRGSNQENPTAVSIVARTLDGMVRMSEAYAKMALKDFVSAEDAEEMIKLEKISLKDIGFDEETGNYDVDIMLTGTSNSKRNKFNKILQKIRELQIADPQTPIFLDDIYETLPKNDGISKDFVKEALEQWNLDGTLYKPPKSKGGYKLSKLPKNKNLKKK